MSELPRRGSAEWPVVPRDAALLSRPRASAKRLARYAESRRRGHHEHGLVETYFAVCEEAGLDPLLVVSQLLLETDHLTARSTRLPSFDPVESASRGEAARAHAGLLLAYALPKGAGDAAQRRLVDEALGRHPVPAKLRGSAPTLDRLAGTWSADPRYPERIREIANEILTPQY
jgi:hypothetical protein